MYGRHYCPEHLKARKFEVQMEKLERARQVCVENHGSGVGAQALHGEVLHGLAWVKRFRGDPDEEVEAEFLAAQALQEGPALASTLDSLGPLNVLFLPFSFFLPLYLPSTSSHHRIEAIRIEDYIE